jgi:iron complex transport system ATP-binding protein
MPKTVLIEKMRCGYPGEFELNGVHFEIKAGDIAGIIGPNGSGKTTLLKGITGEIALLEGRIVLDGKDLAKLNLRERAQNIAVVSQFIEEADITVEEYVLMGRTPYRSNFQFFESEEDFELAEKYMRLTHVFHLKNKLLSHLSGGEQQLAAIARALTQQPKLLLLDEPTSHLDITHQLQILNLIQQLAAELKITVLMVIHDLNLASEYCDYLLMMKRGELFKHGTPTEVLTFQNIEEVYQTVVITLTNPLSNKPAVFLVSDKVLKQHTEG